MAAKKKQLVDTDQPQDSSDQPQASPSEAKVDFLNGVSWSGERFSFIPGDVIELPESIAMARQDAGLGDIIKAG